MDLFFGTKYYADGIRPVELCGEIDEELFMTRAVVISNNVWANNMLNAFLFEWSGAMPIHRRRNTHSVRIRTARRIFNHSGTARLSTHSVQCKQRNVTIDTKKRLRCVIFRKTWNKIFWQEGTSSDARQQRHTNVRQGLRYTITDTPDQLRSDRDYYGNGSLRRWLCVNRQPIPHISQA